jgi:Lar family restriction alleviation protein
MTDHTQAANATSGELLPCPFCGNKDSLQVQHIEGTILHPAYRVHCDNCGGEGPINDRGDHCELWNSRASQPVAAAPAAQAATDIIAEIDATLASKTLNIGRLQSSLAKARAALQQRPAPAQAWTVTRLHDMGSVKDACGELIAQTYYRDAKAFADAHNAALAQQAEAAPAPIGEVKRDAKSGMRYIDWAKDHTLFPEGFKLYAAPVGQAEAAEPPYRVAEFWSSANPGKKVRMLAEGGDIEEWAKRGDFIRWVDAAPAPAQPAAGGDLPPLPDSIDTVHAVVNMREALLPPFRNYFTADQMQDYARAAIAASRAQPALGLQDVAAALARAKAFPGWARLPQPLTADIDAAAHILARIVLDSRVLPAPTQAALDVLAERRRQVEAEGWTPERDDDYADGQLSMAAACYAQQGDSPNYGPPEDWPWNREWWKPSNDRRNLVKAGALILADIERLDRAAAQPQQGESNG